MSTVVITPEPIVGRPGPHVDLLRAAGFEVVFPREPVVFTEEWAIESVRGAGATAVLAGGEPYSEAVLARLPELRIISRCGVGYDAVDVEVATRRGIVLTITPGGNDQA